MSEYGQMIAPYQTHGTGGRGVMDFIQDFMMQNQQRQGMQQQQELLGEQAGVDRQTRNVLNQQQGYAQGVDPFNMQKFAGTQQAQNQQGTLFDQQQSSRQSELDRVNTLMDSLRQNPSYQEDPLIGAMLNSGNTPLGLDQVLPMLTGDRNLAQGREDLVQRNNLNLSNQLQLGEQKSQLLIDRMLAMQPHEMEKLSQTEKMRRESAIELERQRAALGDQRRETEAQSVRNYMSDPNAPLPGPMMQPEFIQAGRESMLSGLAATKAQAVDDQALEKLAAMLGGGNNNIEASDMDLPPMEPNKVLDPRVWTPSREGDHVPQRMYDNAKNILGFVPKTVYHGSHDVGYHGASAIDWLLSNMRF